MDCPNCSAWLVDHRFRRALVCHHCGHDRAAAGDLPECGAAESLIACGPGVERLAEEVADRFPEARTLVLSSDFPGGTERMRRELEAVAKGEFKIVIGTQLVAKGHNFPGLSLVGVVDADLGLAAWRSARGGTHVPDPAAGDGPRRARRAAAGRGAAANLPARTIPC